MDWGVFLLFLATTAVVSGCGAYFGSYLKTKGKNLATREDIDGVVEQVSAVTQATKEIETKISSDLWDRQKQWEMKREVLFEATNSVARVEEQLLRMSSVIVAAKDRIEHPDWIESWHETLVEWRETLARFEKALSLVTIVCSYETAAAFLKFRSLVALVSGRLAKKDGGVYDERCAELTRTAFEIRVAIRKELGVPTPQSAESSETLAPAMQNPAGQ